MKHRLWQDVPWILVILHYTSETQAVTRTETRPSRHNFAGVCTRSIWGQDTCAMGASQLKAVVHLNHVTPPRCRGITGRNLHNKHSVLTEGLIQVRGRNTGESLPFLLPCSTAGLHVYLFQEINLIQCCFSVVASWFHYLQSHVAIPSGVQKIPVVSYTQ